MSLEQRLPVSYLLFSHGSRINRRTFWQAQVFIWLTFFILNSFLSQSIMIYILPILFWSLFCVCAKRAHDLDKSAWLLSLVLIPLIGPLLILCLLGLKGGKFTDNKYGKITDYVDEYLTNGEAKVIPHIKTSEHIVNDVTQINPVIVKGVFKPLSIEELKAFVLSNDEPLSVGGGRFSMGGQTASHQTMHIDMRGLNNVLEFSAQHKTIKVEAGMRWCDIQKYVDPYDLSVKIMQTYANFTVGGSLSVNVHGRYVGLGPLILSVNAIEVILADGEQLRASPTEHQDIFYAVIGGYSGLAIIVSAELQLAKNTCVKRQASKLSVEAYHKYFQTEVAPNQAAIFHNGDIYPPAYTRVNAVTWVETEEQPTVKTRLMRLREEYPLERYFFWAFSETPFGKWRREHIIDPLLFMRKKIHWRNYEAGYDVAELEPHSRLESTYVLQEYFVPVKHFLLFVNDMAEIFNRHEVNVVNVSIRHAKADSGSLLAWARKESYAFVVYYKQRTHEIAKRQVAVWTRELIDAVIKYQGAYYLPYQAHATPEQFHQSYPNARKLFALKDRLDPHYRLRNVLWDTYYKPSGGKVKNSESEFRQVFCHTKSRDAFFRFLQVVFHLYPEDKFHALIDDVCQKNHDDETIYHEIQSFLPSIKPFLADVRFALPALQKQKREMVTQTIKLLNGKSIDGYLELGTAGRYIKPLSQALSISGSVYLLSDEEPSHAIGDIFERGGISKPWRYVPLEDYAPISEHVASESLDLVSCYIGLHHCPLEKLEAFMASIHRVLRPGGVFILRDHDVKSKEMHQFVSLVHTVFNMGLFETWAFNQQEFRKFRPISEWVGLLNEVGLTDSGQRLLQANDPSDNTLLLFEKVKK